MNYQTLIPDLKLAYLVLQIVVKEFFETQFYKKWRNRPY